MSNSSWKEKPENGEWNNVDNWTDGVPADAAVFGASQQTTISFNPDGKASVKSIQFSESAPAYTLQFGTSENPDLTIAGDGVTNNSGKQQGLVVAATSPGHKNPQLMFSGSASAGGDDMFYCAGPVTRQGYGGGIISFCDSAGAGAATFKVWTGAESPRSHKPSTVGGEVSFSNTTSADTARFFIYGTLGTDGDTFGNVVFHDTATAASAMFTNVGGTVAKGDGGNTQFYGSSTAASGVFSNQGATHEQANGGDVAFDSTSNGGYGIFYNYAAEAANGYGGVTSFNNNKPYMKSNEGASAANGSYFNYGAGKGQQGGGGHVFLSSKYGSPSAGNATITNYGSMLADKSSAGHTILSISLPNKDDYFPDAATATFRNYPALNTEGAAGYTELAIFGEGSVTGNVPTAGKAAFYNLGADIQGAAGGYTVFSGAVKADSATLIAYGGINGGYGGRVLFMDQSSGGSAAVQLSGNGELDISYHDGGLTIGRLELNSGIIRLSLGSSPTTLTVAAELAIISRYINFSFRKKRDGGFELDTPYTILVCDKLSQYSKEVFRGNSIDNVDPDFTIEGNELKVTFRK